MAGAVGLWLIPDIKKLSASTRSAIALRATAPDRATAGRRLKFVHVAIDDHSGVAFAKVMSSEK
jgi:hypothetical protein